MKFKARVEMWLEADSEQDAMANVVNMMDELQENHLDPETNDPWLEDWAMYGSPWLEPA